MPLSISSVKTPKAKTSDFIEYNPSIAYSGDIYPLQVHKVLNLAFEVNVFVHACVCEREKERESYYVPTALFVFASIWSSPNILAKPKSEIFGFTAASSSTLLAFRSLEL